MAANNLSGIQVTGDYSEDEISDDEGDNHPELDDQIDQNELKPGNYALGLSKSYVPGWEGKEAFREFYQNWKDGIIDSFDLEPRSFKPVYKETQSEILITVDRANTGPATPQQNELLGFIRFSKKAGSLELANFKAGLTRRNLDLGDTTKRKKANQAGIHGEGFKVASLVMCRNEQRVRYSTSSYYLNFQFRGKYRKTLYCNVTQPKSKTLRKQQDAYNKIVASGKPRAPKANTWEDLSVVIGKGRLGVDVALEEFLKWLKVTIDVNPPSDIMETDFGDLILDGSFAGKVYLKGLLLPNASSSVKSFVYGYNLLQGCTNRDRGRLTDPSEEADQLRSIWEQAIDKRHELVDKYVNLLQHHQDCGDISLAENKVAKATAEKIWANLFSKTDGERFYFRERDGNHNIELIRSSLKRSPVPLPKGLWNILTRFDLVRTPQEEIKHLFTTSATSACQTSLFSENVQRALRAALALNERTSDVTVLFVEGGQVGIDLLYEPEKKTVKVHEKWLNFEEIHKTATCHVSRLATTQSVASEVLFCDHIIEEIYGMVLSEIVEGLGLRQNESIVLERSLRNEVRDKLQQMPRGICVTSTQLGGELEVCWWDSESALVSKFFPDTKIHIVLHRENTCSGERSNLLHQQDPQRVSPQSNEGRCLSGQTIAPCGCYQQVSPLKNEGVTFRGLDPLQEYFAMVAPLGKSSIFGRPPPPAKPKPLKSAFAAAISSAIPDDVKPIHLPCSGGYDSDHTDDTHYREPTPYARIGAPTDRPESVRNENLRDTSRNLSSGGRLRPNSAARPLLDDAHTEGMGEDTGLSATPPRPDLREEEEIVVQGRLQQQREAKLWKTWEESNMNDSFSLFTPKGLTKPLGIIAHCPSAKHYTEQRLNYSFEEGEYVHVELHSTDLWGESSMYILKVHGEDEAAEKELVLHFDDFESMGQKQDAELLPIDNIDYAQRLDVGSEESADPVIHVIKAPGDPARSEYFCRFAIRSWVDLNSSSITPLSSNLLPRRDRWKAPCYKYPCTPALFDLTPNVLGTAEGLSQASFEVYAGLGFDKTHRMTWKARHHSAHVYDGSPANVLDDLASPRLVLPTLPGPEIAKVVTVSGANEKFVLSDQDIQGAGALRRFLEPLEILKAAVRSAALSPDFLVMTMPFEILHESVVGTLIRTVFTLLRHRYSVHLRKLSVQKCGVPQDRNVIVLLASPICAEPHWAFESLAEDRPLNKAQSLTIGDAIEDLSFNNSRPLEPGGTAFVCKYTPNLPLRPFAISARTASPAAILYNHKTGLLRQGSEPMTMDATATSLDPRTTASWTHPARGDLLTVRELARIQGFPDDFVFYDSDPYEQVIAAFPPPIATKIGETISRTIYQYRLVRGDESGNAVKTDVTSSKRPRGESISSYRSTEDMPPSKKSRVEVGPSPTANDAPGPAGRKHSSVHSSRHNQSPNGTCSIRPRVSNSPSLTRRDHQQPRGRESLHEKKNSSLHAQKIPETHGK